LQARRKIGIAEQPTKLSFAGGALPAATCVPLSWSITAIHFSSRELALRISAKRGCVIAATAPLCRAK
jgi:hypothetical protein